MRETLPLSCRVSPRCESRRLRRVGVPSPPVHRQLFRDILFKILNSHFRSQSFLLIHLNKGLFGSRVTWAPFLLGRFWSRFWAGVKRFPVSTQTTGPQPGKAGPPWHLLSEGPEGNGSRQGLGGPTTTQCRAAQKEPIGSRDKNTSQVLFV